MPPPDLTADLAPDPPTHSVTADPPTADPPPDLTGDLSSAPAAPGGPPVVPGYDVRDELGRGGMGVVYRAVHLKLNRAVALKVARADDRADPRHLLRFLAEAEAAAAVKHPHVVGVYDSGAAGGRPYLAMELCPGGTLADRLKASGRLDPRDAAALVGKLAGAVQACHDAGIVHRDLKPANVLFDAAGEPKVTDFGLVKRGLGSDLTATQAVMGTPAYMTPEQATGGAKFVGPAADIYALGTVLYECLTGARPFDGPDTLVLLKRIAEDPPEPPRKRVPSIPRDIELVCLRCLEKAPADRYPTAAALADDLRRFAAGEPVSVRPAGVVERTYKWARRKPTVAALYAAALAGAVLVAVATAIGLLWRDAEAARRTAEAERGRAEAAQGEAERARDQIAGEQGKTAAALSDAESARDLLRQEREKLALSEYARTMEVAHQEALGNNVAGAMALLEGTRPDLRGWEWHYVHKLCNGQQGTLPGRYGGRWSPDGSRLLTYGRNGIAQVYDTRTWAVSTTLTGHAKEGVSWGALSPDGSKVASFGERTVRVWDLSTGAELLALKGHNEAAYAVWSGDGGRLASIGGDDTVRVWDARTGTEVRAIRVLKPKEDNRVTLSPDGSNLATNTHRDPTVRVWDTRSGTLQATLQGHTDSVVEAVWSPDGRRFTTASHDTTVRVWDAKTWAEVAVLRGHTGFVWSAVWSPDGARLATASEDGTARVWEARSGGGLFVLSGHTRALSEIAWSPDGLRLLTASWDGTARVWDAKTGTEVVALRGHASGVGSASWSPDGRRVATSSDDGTVRVWDSGAEPRQVVLQGHQGVVQKAAWSPDRSRVATTSFDRTARVWDAKTGASVAALSGHTDAVWSALWSPDGIRLATGSQDGTARVWDARTGSEQLVLRHGDPVNVVAWSPDGSKVATSSETTRVWDARTGAEVVSLRAPLLSGVCAVWSPDGSKLLAVTAEGSVGAWDARSGILLDEHQGRGRIDSFAYSPDGTQLAAFSRWGLSQIVEADTGVEVVPLRALTGAAVETSAWSPDGRRLTVGLPDGTVRVLDPATGNAVLNLGERRGGKAVSGLTWTLDGSAILTAHADGTLRTWGTTPTDPRFLPANRVAPPPREAKR